MKNHYKKIKKGSVRMKKLAMFFLMAVLVIFNATSVSAAEMGSVRIGSTTINVGKKVVNESFTKTFTIINDSVSYRKIKIDIDSNDLGVKLDSTEFTLKGHENKTITVTGKFPSYNGSFHATLTVKDDLSTTNDIVIFINGEAVAEGSGSDNGSTKETVPQPKNVRVTSKPVGGDNFEYTITWDKADMNGVTYTIYRHDEDRHAATTCLDRDIVGTSYKLLVRGDFDTQGHDKLIFYVSAHKDGYQRSKSVKVFGPVVRRNRSTKDPNYHGINDCEEAKNARKPVTGRRTSIGGKAGTSRGRGGTSSGTGTTRRGSSTGTGSGTGSGRRRH